MPQEGRESLSELAPSGDELVTEDRQEKLQASRALPTRSSVSRPSFGPPRAVAAEDLELESEMLLSSSLVKHWDTFLAPVALEYDDALTPFKGVENGFKETCGESL